MQSILRLSQMAAIAPRIAGRYVGWLIVPLVLVILFDVVTRKLEYTSRFFSGLTMEYGYSVSTIVQDLQWHFHAAILLLSFGYGYLTNAHVRVDVFREMLPRRQQAWIELVALILMGVPFLLVLIFYGFDLFEIAWRQNEHSESATGLNWRWFIKFFMPLGFLCLMLAILATIGRLLAYLFGSEFDAKEALEELEIFADDHAELEAARRAAEEELKAEAKGRLHV